MPEDVVISKVPEEVYTCVGVLDAGFATGTGIVMILEAVVLFIVDVTPSKGQDFPRESLVLLQVTFQSADFASCR